MLQQCVMAYKFRETIGHQLSMIQVPGVSREELLHLHPLWVLELGKFLLVRLWYHHIPGEVQDAQRSVILKIVS